MLTTTIRISCLALLALGIFIGDLSASGVEHFDKPPSIKDLEQRLNDIDAELETLAGYSLRGGVGSVGYRSQAHEDYKAKEWIQIDLGVEEVIDEIVLVPTIWRDTKTGFRADGFPEEFKIIVGSKGAEEGQVIATYGPQDKLLPRIAPLVIPCDGVAGSWVRVETTKLSRRAWDKKYILQLFEILVFSGEDNIALQKPVEVSSPYFDDGGNRDKNHLVDGFGPYLMDASQGEQSPAFFIQLPVEAKPTFTVDLGVRQTLNRIHIHALDLSDTVPQSFNNGFGMPRRLLVEGSDHADFSKFERLVEYQIESVYDAGPILTLGFAPVTCRYVRIAALEPFQRISRGRLTTEIGFAEIELFSNGQNVALEKTFESNFLVNHLQNRRTLRSLTDGRNLYGEILPTRAWMGELARRHVLEEARPRLVAELELRYARQTTNLNRLGWLAVLLAAGIVVTILVERLIRMRHVAKVRLRLAADLHDELGANLHTIGLLSDMATETIDDPEELSTLHRRIRSETERSGIAVRHCTDMLEPDELYTDMKEDMERAGRRIMAKLEHSITVTGEEYLSELKPRTRIDLFLFFKESLVNISRHSGATKFQSHLIADKKRVQLTISDNGKGLEAANGMLPKSLKRRAKLLHAKVQVETPESGGTRIKLVLSTRRWKIFS